MYECSIPMYEECSVPDRVTVSMDDIVLRDIVSLPAREARLRFERAYFKEKLARSGGSITKLAATSQVERTHLYRKLRSLKIDPTHPRKPHTPAETV